MAGWQQQYRRMRRSLERFESVRRPDNPLTSDEATDVMYHFFQDAYHLKDWLKNDPAAAAAVGPNGSMVETMVSTVQRSLVDNDGNAVLAPVMALCADVANGSKHLKLTSSRTKDDKTGLVGLRMAVMVGKGGVAIEMHLRSNNVTFNAHELARAIAAAWDEWLTAQGLSWS